MGKWRDAADGVKPANGKAKGCDFGKYIKSLPDDERSELEAIIADAVERIPLNAGRWTYIRNVLVEGGAPAFDTGSIAKHCRGEDTCQGS